MMYNDEYVDMPVSDYNKPSVHDAIGNIKLLKEMLLNGANPDALNYEQMTALMVASKYGYADEADLLIEEGANAKYQIKGVTALHIAAQGFGKGPGENKTERIIRALVKAGVDVNMPDDEGYTPLHCAAYDGDSQDILVELGANPNAKNNKGQTPLHIAVESGNAGIVKTLLELGALPNIPDAFGKKPADYIPLLPKELQQEMRESFKAGEASARNMANTIRENASAVVFDHDHIAPRYSQTGNGK